MVDPPQASLTRVVSDQCPAARRRPSKPAQVHSHIGTQATQACMIFAAAHEANAGGKATA